MLFVAFTTLNILGQSHREAVQKLERDLTLATDHQETIKLLLELSTIYRADDPDKAMQYVQRALTISKNIGFEQGEVIAFNRIGNLLLDKSNYTAALESFYAGLGVNQDRNDDSKIGESYILIGRVHLAARKFKDAHGFFNKAKLIGETIQDNALQSLACTAFSDLMFLQNKKNLALSYSMEAMNLMRNENQDLRLANCIKHAAKKHKQLSQYQLALTLYEECRKMYENLGNEVEQAIVCFEMGDLFQELRDFDNALQYMSLSLGFAQKTQLKSYIKLGYQNLSKVYVENGDYRRAYNYLKYYTAIKGTSEISELETQLELETQRRKNAELNQRIVSQQDKEAFERFIMYAIIGATLLVSLVLAFVYRAYLVKKQSNIDLEKAKEQAERSEQEKERFLAYTSHEIRTPLNAVVGLSKMLEKTELSDEQSKMLSTIQKSAQNILFIVNDVLDLSKIESGAVQFENIDFMIRDLIDSLVATMQFKAANSKVRLFANVDPEVPEVVKGDPVRLNQILLNLVDNALKFTEHGEVKISLDLERKMDRKVKLRFEVKDDGTGIRQSRINSIFERYKQESSGTSRRHGGTGLGLPITKQLIELMGSRIYVDSEYGKGTTFFFSLVLRQGKNAIKTVALKTPNNNQLLKNLNILFVDDNQLNREIFYDMVNDVRNNVAVDLADDGKMAIRKIEQSKYDIILMDLQMPRMDGFEATRHIRKNFNNGVQNTPIIAVTAHVLSGVITKCKEAGMSDFITKPINNSELIGKIQALIGMQGNDLLEAENLSDTKSEIGANQKLSLPKYQNIDLGTLLEVSGGKPEKMLQYIEIFLKTVPTDLAAVGKSLQDEQWTEIGRLAHKIKGNLVYVGATPVLEDFILLEALKQQVGENDKITDIVSRVTNFCEIVIKELNQLKPILKDQIT